jgi:selenoprotein W-related protein
MRRLRFEYLLKEAGMSDVSIIFCQPCGYKKRAQEAASALQAKLGIDAKLVAGTRGVFEVRVGEKVVTKRVKGHFPDAAEIVGAVIAAGLR